MPMTNKETIEYLSHFLKPENKECYADKLIEAIETSISALEKQIPRKPTYTFKYFLCGKCGAHIGVRTNQYCSDCGQKIDWSVES